MMVKRAPCRKQAPETKRPAKAGRPVVALRGVSVLRATLAVYVAVVDLDLFGFSEAELDALLGDFDCSDEGAVDGEDEVPEPPADPVFRPGVLWIMGNHRLLCGYFTVATDVE